MKDIELQAERKAFEAWYEAYCMPSEADWFRRDVDDESEYHHAITADAWAAWKARAAIEAAMAQRVPDGKVLVDRGALNMVINALRRDAADGRAVRGEMADALLASTPAPAQQERCPSCRTGSIYACTCPFPTAQHQEPPQQERKPMTYREIADATSEWAHVRSDYTIGIIRAAERHHGIRKD